MLNKFFLSLIVVFTFNFYFINESKADNKLDDYSGYKILLLRKKVY